MASDGEMSDPEQAPQAPVKPEPKAAKPKKPMTAEARDRLTKARTLAIAARKEKAAARREEKELHEKIKEGERHKLRQAAAEAERLVNGEDPGPTSKPQEVEMADPPKQPTPQPAKRAREPEREEEQPRQRHAPRDDDVDWRDYDARQRARDMYKQALARQRGALITRTLYGF